MCWSLAFIWSAGMFMMEYTSRMPCPESWLWVLDSDDNRSTSFSWAMYGHAHPTVCTMCWTSITSLAVAVRAAHEVPATRQHLPYWMKPWLRKSNSLPWGENSASTCSWAAPQQRGVPSAAGKTMPVSLQPAAQTRLIPDAMASFTTLSSFTLYLPP